METRKEIELEEKTRMLEKEIATLTQQVDQMRRDAREQIDLLKIDLATLKVLMNEVHPGFKKRYIEVKEKISRKVDPETLM